MVTESGAGNKSLESSSSVRVRAFVYLHRECEERTSFGWVGCQETRGLQHAVRFDEITPGDWMGRGESDAVVALRGLTSESTAHKSPEAVWNSWSPLSKDSSWDRQSATAGHGWRSDAVGRGRRDSARSPRVGQCAAATRSVAWIKEQTTRTVARPARFCRRSRRRRRSHHCLLCRRWR